MKKTPFTAIFFIALALIIISSVTKIAHADTSSIPFSGVTIEPDHSVRSAGYVLRINLQASAADSDMVVNGSCKVNGVDVSKTLENHTGGLYNVVYTVGAHDADAASGQIPISCTLRSPSTHDVVTATHFTDNNNTGIDPDFVTNWKAVSAGPTSETITATTAFPTNVDIEYTLNGHLYTTPLDTPAATSHSITITGLIPNTSYVYEVVATKPDGVEGTSPELIPFKTLPLYVPNPVVVAAKTTWQLFIEGLVQHFCSTHKNPSADTVQQAVAYKWQVPNTETTVRSRLDQIYMQYCVK